MNSKQKRCQIGTQTYIKRESGAGGFNGSAGPRNMRFRVPLGPQLGSNLDPKMALELPKSRPRGAHGSFKRPFGAKNRPKAAQNPHPSLILDHFGKGLIKMLDHFSQFLEGRF